MLSTFVEFPENPFDSFREPGTHFLSHNRKEFSQIAAKLRASPCTNFFNFKNVFPTIHRFHTCKVRAISSSIRRERAFFLKYTRFENKRHDYNLNAVLQEEMPVNPNPTFRSERIFDI